ncbi:hypothetical protein HNR27_002618 [Ornithinibacillus bavariensis]
METVLSILMVLFTAGAFLVTLLNFIRQLINDLIKKK